MNQLTVHINIRKSDKSSFSREEAEDDILHILELLGDFTNESEYYIEGGIVVTPVERSKR